MTPRSAAVLALVVVRSGTHPKIGYAIPGHPELMAGYARLSGYGGVFDGRAGEGREVRGGVTELAGSISRRNMRRQARGRLLQGGRTDVRERQARAMALRTVV